jgi:phage protein D
MASAAAPVQNKRPTVRIDTKEFPLISEQLIAMDMTEREGGLSSLEMRVSGIASNARGGADFPFEDSSILKLGGKIAVYAGDQNGPQEIFSGTITGLEGEFGEGAPPEVVILAEDALQDARMKRRTALYEKVSIADLAKEIANRLSLTPKITGFTDKIGTQVQLDETDLGFLRRVIARYDGDVQVVGTELHVSPRGEVRRGAVIDLTMNREILRARVLADLSHQVTEVTVTGWDAVQGQRVKGTSSGANAGPGSGTKGSEILRNATGERSEHIGHVAVSTDGEARALADTAFDRVARRFVRLDATASGDPALRVGTHIKVTGISKRFDNTYYIVHACHRYTVKRGYETDFEAECAFVGVA